MKLVALEDEHDGYVVDDDAYLGVDDSYLGSATAVAAPVTEECAAKTCIWSEGCLMVVILAGPNQ